MSTYTTPEFTTDKVTEGYNKVQFFGEKVVKTKTGQSFALAVFKHVKEDGTLEEKEFSISILDRSGKLRASLFNELREALGFPTVGPNEKFYLPDFGQVPPEWMTPINAFFNQSTKEERFIGKDGLEKIVHPMQISLFIRDGKVFIPADKPAASNLAQLEAETI